MNDAAEMLLSWLLLLVAFVFIMTTGFFLMRTNEINTLHEEINPIVEDYGGVSSTNLNGNGDNSKAKIDAITNHASNGALSFNVVPASVPSVKASGYSSMSYGKNNPKLPGVAKFGRPLAYTLNFKIPYYVMDFGATSKKSLNGHIKFYTTSKVGQ